MRVHAQGGAPDESRAVSAVSRCKEVRVDQGGVDTHGGEVLTVLAAPLALAPPAAKQQHRGPSWDLVKIFGASDRRWRPPRSLQEWMTQTPAPFCYTEPPSLAACGVCEPHKYSIEQQRMQVEASETREHRETFIRESI